MAQTAILSDILVIRLTHSTSHQLHLQRAARIHAMASAETSADFLQHLVIDDIIERLSSVQRHFDQSVALYGRTPYLAQQLASCPNTGIVHRVEEGAWIGDVERICPSPDQLELEEASLDLVVAPLSLHWAKDLPGALIQMRRALRPDGLMMTALPGPETLSELRQCLLEAESQISNGAALRIDPYTDIRDAGALLQRAGFALPVVDQDTLTIRYDDVFGLIRDLRGFGATGRGNSENPPLNRHIVARMAELYQSRFSDPDGRIRATFQVVSLSGWAPDESQQKPLKPGTAKARLADALNTDEQKL